MEMDFNIQTDLTTQSILLASANHDVTALQDLLRNSSANVQDPETHLTPLHAAIAALEPDDQEHSTVESAATNGYPNGESTKAQPSAEELDAALKTVQYLLDNHAAWNAVDSNDDTPGCVAYRMGLQKIYEAIVDAGVRAELTTPTSDGYQLLADADEEEAEETNEEGDALDEHMENGTEADPIDQFSPASANAQHGTESSNHPPTHFPRSITLSTSRVPESLDNASISWESQIMQHTAASMLSRTGLRVLNVGHGSGDLDTHMRRHHNKPTEHRLTEANPRVLFEVRKKNWFIESGVYVHEGRWQEIIPRIIEQDMKFDAVYFHPRGEDYEALREFFSTYLKDLLAPRGENNEGGVFGFYNAMGADRKVCYDVYQKVVEKNLLDSGFNVQWEDVHLVELSTTNGQNANQNTWKFDKYRLPTCRLQSPD